MIKVTPWILSTILFFTPFISKGQDKGEFQSVAPQYGWQHQLRIKTNLIPWIATIPNVGMEYTISRKWSAEIDIWYCPWTVNSKYSVKTASLLPEVRYWIKDNTKGSFFNLHLNIAWFNVRVNHYRYQDMGTPLLGAGIGYGYRFDINPKWGFEMEIGAGVSKAKYERYYNVNNGALKDSRTTTYFGVDRFSIAFSYNLCDL